MKKGIVLGIVFLFVVMSFTSISGIQINENTIKSSGGGNTLYVGGSGEGNYTTIQSAINDANSGDTVFVYDDSSPYYEWDILIEKSINLIGENRDTTVIDCNDHKGIKIFITSSVTISGFSIINSEYGYGIWVEISSNIIISDNHILNCFWGIELAGIDESFIISNTFEECYIAIHFFAANGITISDNIIISSTEMYDPLGDISVDGYNNVITNNSFICTNKELYRIGIHLESVSDTIIHGNEFSGYNGAIYFYMSNRHNIISHNNITNNNCGINFFLFSFSNKILNNNFVDNSYDTNFFLFNPNNYWDGNYWDKWIGNRFNLPIFQKFPKIIFGGLGFGIDWHPAKELNDINATQGYWLE